ncbi:MAG: VWA domain-containing protein, partial [Kofleriaceae bacterium]|nr:VWA domain-containing protein [Kofleriaceae bacterium]
MRIVSSFLATALLATTVSLVACTDREVARVDPKQNKEQEKEIPVEVNRDLDILFVIDNSNSMRDEQISLAANFGNFINVLNNIEGGLPNIHIGVITTDLGAGPYNITGCTGNGDNGVLQNAAVGPAGCSTPTDKWISDIGDEMGNRTKNYAGGLSEAFSCIAQLGVNGCGFEQPLESMRLALDNTSGQNTGFLRPEAFLAVIIITDEDDCSAKDPSIFNSDPSLDNINSAVGFLSSFRCFEFGVTC